MAAPPSPAQIAAALEKRVVGQKDAVREMSKVAVQRLREKGGRVVKSAADNQGGDADLVKAGCDVPFGECSGYEPFAGAPHDVIDIVSRLVGHARQAIRSRVDAATTVARPRVLRK